MPPNTPPTVGASFNTSTDRPTASSGIIDASMPMLVAVVVCAAIYARHWYMTMPSIPSTNSFPRYGFTTARCFHTGRPNASASSTPASSQR